VVRRIDLEDDSHPGCVVAADVTLDRGVRCTAVSMYGRQEYRKQIDGEPYRLRYAVTAVHRMLSDLTPLVDLHGRARVKAALVLGGDLNVSSQIDPPDRRRHREVLDRFAGLGLQDAWEAAPATLRAPDCACADETCRHVRTHTHRRSPRPWQLPAAMRAIAPRSPSQALPKRGTEHTLQGPASPAARLALGPGRWCQQVQTSACQQRPSPRPACWTCDRLQHPAATAVTSRRAPRSEVGTSQRMPADRLTPPCGAGRVVPDGHNLIDQETRLEEAGMPQVLWEDTELYGFVVEPADRFEHTLATMRTLRGATSWGDVRTAALAPWATALIAQHEEYLADEAGTVPDDDEPWDYEAISESVVEVIPLSHDADGTRAWLNPALLAAHADISGTSPGGHSAGYRIRDRDAFLAALHDAGYEPVHRPGLLQQVFSA